MDYKYRDNFPTSSIKNLIIRTIGIIHKEFWIYFFFLRSKEIFFFFFSFLFLIF